LADVALERDRDQDRPTSRLGSQAAQGGAMNLHSGRPLMTRALITGAVVLVFWPAGGALAQDAAPTSPAPRSDAAAEPTVGSRSARERRRASRADAEAPPAPAVPSVAEAQANAAEPVSEPAEPERVCKNIKPTGTRVAKRVCGTPEQWAAMERTTTDAAQEGMRQVRDQTSIVVTQPTPPLGAN
jgi:hypothetical protein